MRKRLFLILLPALTIGAAGCSYGNQPTPTAPYAPSTMQSAGTSSPSPAADTPAKTVLNQVIHDDLLGDTITVSAVVRNFPVPDRLPAFKDSRELVLVKLTLSAGEKYAAGLPNSNFRVVTDGGGDLNSSTSVVNAEMKAAGYNPLPDGGADPGQTVTGWDCFAVSPLHSKTLKFRAKRLAATVVGSGASIPAAKFDVPLTS